MARHVCITGCTRGLGRALTQWFFDEGWTVSGFGRNEEAIRSLNEYAPEGRGFFRVVDATDEPAVAAFAKELETALGLPDLLINNAGVINKNAPLWEVPADEFSQVIDVNIKGVANCLRHFTPRMIDRGNGIIINLSSGWGRSTSPEVAPYCASKWAIEGLSQAMSHELPNGIAVAAMNPGIIDTEMLRSCFGENVGAYGDANHWAQRAGPYLADLDTTVNGRALTAP